MKTYFNFLANAVFRRYTLWIISVVYMLVIVSLMVIVPIIANVFYLVMYSLTFAFVQVIFLYVTAIFSALIAVYVFKILSDDGTELLINSKPLARTKTVTIKFVVFILVSLFFAFFSSLAVLFVFLLPNIVYPTVFSLWGTVIVGNIICMFFFGSISVFFCLWFNKIVVIVLNVVLCVLMVIYSTVVLAIAPDPASKLSSNQHMTSMSMNTLNKNGDYVYNAAFIPMSFDTSNLSSLNQLTYDGQVEVWNQALKDYPMGAVNAFNMAWGLGSTYLLGLVGQIAINQNGTSGMGSNTKLTYNILSKSHEVSLRDPSIEQTWDDSVSWTDMGNSNYPAYYASFYGVSRQSLADLISLNNSGSLLNLQDFISSYFTTYMTFHFSCLGSEIDDGWNGNSYGTISNGDHWTLKNGIAVANYYDGNIVKKNKEKYLNYTLEPNDEEKDFFNFVIYELLFDSNSEIYKNTFKTNADGTLYLNSNLTATLATSNGQQKYNFYQELYDLFYDKSITENGLNAANRIGIKNETDYGLEVLKFKYYFWNQMNGQYIKTDEGLNNANYQIINYIDANGTKPIVPFKDYYSLVFIPQFNSVNLQTNLGDISPYLPEEYQELALILQDLFSNGLIPLSSNLIDEGTLLAKVLPFIGFDSIKSTAVISDATPEYTQYSNEYLSYDLTDTTVGNPSQLGTYGYYSPIEVKIQTLINSSFVKDNSLSYYEGQYKEAYQSKLYQHYQILPIYQWSMYTYSYSNDYQYLYIIAYLSITFVILGYSFKKYCQIDYH